MPALPSLIPRKPKDLIAAPLSAFESETQAIIQRTTPYSEHAVLHLLGAMIVISITLMAVVKIDRVVAGPGKIVPTEGSLYVQPLETSIVKEILVKQGDVVKKGQVLATLDPTFAAADYTTLVQKVDSDGAMVKRLEAEREGKPYEPGPDASAYEQLQLSISHQRQSEYEQGIRDFDARMRSTEAGIAKLQQDIANYTKRQGLAAKVESMQQELEHDGWGSKLKTMAATDSRVEVDRMLSESESDLSGSQHDLTSLQAQRSVFVSKWQDDLQTLLVTAKNSLDGDQQDLAKAAKVRDLVSLEAPQDAVVLDIGNASKGSVIDSQAAAQQPLFTLVPLNGPLEAEVQIDSQDIGFVQSGDHVEVKLDAYPFIRHGTAKGRIETISEGSFTMGDNQQIRSPFFKARVAISETNLRNVPATFRLIPGMTVTGDVLVGHRTILSYLIEGGLRTGSEAMREP